MLCHTYPACLINCRQPHKKSRNLNLIKAELLASILSFRSEFVYSFGTSRINRSTFHRRKPVQYSVIPWRSLQIFKPSGIQILSYSRYVQTLIKGRSLYTTTYKNARRYVTQYVYPHNLVVFHTSLHGFDRFLEVFAKLEKLLLASSCLSVCLSVCPHEATRFPLERCSRNLVYEDFSKICRKIQVPLKFSKSDVYFTRTPMNIY